jgi:hypothetical protein
MRFAVLWVLRIVLAVLLFQTIASRINMDRLPVQSAVELPFIIFWWQEILYIIFLFIGVKALVLPEEISPNEVVLLFLKIAADFARNMNWLYYFISILSWVYYSHWSPPDTVIYGCLILTLILILAGEKLYTPLNILVAYLHIYICLLAGNFWGVVVGLVMTFNYTRPGVGGGNNFPEWIARTSVEHAWIFFGGHAVLIFAMNIFLRILQDQSSVIVKDYSPFSIDFGRMVFWREDYVT